MHDIVIIGGGIWGLSTAYHLASRDQRKRVLVLERNPEVAAETTPQAAGLVGQIRSSRLMCEAIQYALELFSAFQQKGYDTGLHQPGSLMIAHTPERMERYALHIAQAQANGVEAGFISRAEIRRLVPSIDITQIEGGYFVPTDGFVDPRQCALAYAAAASDLGVDIQCNARVTGVQIVGGRVTGVETLSRCISADQVVVAAGPWSNLLLRRVGLSLPMHLLLHQSGCTVACPGIAQHHPVVRLPDISSYLRPDGAGGYLFGTFEQTPTGIELEQSSMDYSTKDIPPQVEKIAEAQKRLASTFPVLSEIKIRQYRQGITAFTPDGAYLIGAVPEVLGLFFASGDSAIGIAGSAAVGRWLAEWISDGAPSNAVGAFDPRRFGDQPPGQEHVRRESEDVYSNYYSK